MRNEDFLYRFSYGDPGMFLELYVPTSYEPEVRRVLERGADIVEVREYLKDKRNMEQIKELLSENEELTKKYDESRVDDLGEKILGGFSIYRGDGAFFVEKQIERDHISVVRLMFTPPLEDWLSQDNSIQTKTDFKERLTYARFAARHFLRFWTHDATTYLRYREKCFVSPDKSERAPTEANESEYRNKFFETPDTRERDLIEKLTKWLDDIALLVNGYIVHQLCCESVRRSKAGLSKKPEDQIWVGSFRSLAVNKVTYCGTIPC